MLVLRAHINACGIGSSFSPSIWNAPQFELRRISHILSQVGGEQCRDMEEGLGNRSRARCAAESMVRCAQAEVETETM